MTMTTFSNSTVTTAIIKSDLTESGWHGGNLAATESGVFV